MTDDAEFNATNKPPSRVNAYSRIFKFVDVVAVALLFSLLSIGIYLISTYNPHVWVDLVVDDAYYYLGIARNVTQGLGSTYLLPTHTNGYQPLWMLILVSTSKLFGVSDRALMLQIFSLSFLFVFAFAFLSRKYYGYYFPAIALSLAYPIISLYGMETTLLPPLIVLFFSSRNWQERGIWSSLMFLARLDALALVIARDAYVYFRDHKNNFKHYFIVIPVAGLYCLINYYYFDVFFPVSGLAKSVGNIRGENVYPFLSYLSESSSLAMFIPIMCIIFFRKQIYHFRYREEIVSCSLAILICATYYSFNSGWPVWEWYYWPILMLLFYFSLEIINFYTANLSGYSLAINGETQDPSDEMQGARPGHVNGFLKTGYGRYIYNDLILLMIVVVTLTAVFYPASYDISRRFKLFFKPENRYTSWGKRNVELAEDIKRSNLPKNTMFAMGDRAGSLGFFLGPSYRFMQTEGIVASTEYYRSMTNDSTLGFLENMPIDYFVVERGDYLYQDNIIGIIEPIQALSSHYGQFLVCFNRSDALIDKFGYLHRRYMFRFKQHIQCPNNLVNQYLELKSKYGGVRKLSLPEEYYKGPLQSFFHLDITNLPHF
jgi:hypothetical protein